ncbi:YkgJ family cysteine cluster protein [Halomicrococcus sp. NG-SE-24]|uniref:YkgJ family cysteine cluster protein n=1 Tax=Halomicrococcus sp. NG-SE-24 TaxID=3436928 RepID=UPI003D9819F8
MEVNCEGCAGCCIDWRALASERSDHERRGPRTPLDDAYNLVPLTRGDARDFLDAGLADALTPRLWRDESGVTVDGVELAAIDGKPVFFLGLRKPPKPVAPFDTDPRWLPTCVFLDPATLQCRIHDRPEYPTECAEYPGHNLELGSTTECERVEATFGGDRLLDDDPPDDLSGLLLGPQAVGEKVFVYPDPDDLAGVLARLLADDLTREDRARFVAAAVAGRPGTTSTDREQFAAAFADAKVADSWAGRAVAEWESLEDGGDAPRPDAAERVEDDRGAPPTPGW